MFELSLILSVALNGISFAMILFLLASGFEIIAGVMNIVNLAHGSFFMLGAYTGVTVIRRTGSFLLGVIAGTAIVGLLGLLTERFLFRHLREHQQHVFLTFGIVYVLTDVTRMIWGADPYGVSAPAIFAGSIDIMGRTFPIFRLFLIPVGLLVALGLWLFQNKTRLGAIVRAGVDDSEMVGVIGINIRLLSMWVFTGGLLLAGFGGVMSAPIIAVVPGLDWEVLNLALVVVVVGGLGSLGGALVGSILIGLADSFGRFLLPEISIILTFAILAIILTTKPSGIFGD
jgi:branched-chain amino acid transport system permease protein